MLGGRFTQVKDGIRCLLLRQRLKIRDAAAFVKESKIKWDGHVMRFNSNRWTRAVSDWVPCDIKRTTGRPPSEWSDFFMMSFKENYDALAPARPDQKINGSRGDQGDNRHAYEFSWSPPPKSKSACFIMFSASFIMFIS
ncbi:hypothetical protein RB195_011207 [Necator americanus]|uniref:NOT2/NOT3/NOT5 C-terminal domain-containing protein n=1 Tax=Necator americanus TaxID=51031 RepID=A0ABR1D1E4_NECAM